MMGMRILRIHTVAANLLGWSTQDTKSMSLRTLREVLRTLPASKRRDEIISEINAAEGSGRVVTQEGYE